MGNLILIKNPFNRVDRDVKYLGDYSPSISALIDEHIPKGMEIKVSINSIIIDPSVYTLTFPKAGDEVVMVPYVYGDKSGKSVLRVVLLIVVAIIASYAGPIIGGATYGGLASGIITIVGGILVNMLVPPIIPDGPEGRETSLAYSWSPRLTQQQGLSMPRWYGYNRIRSGNIIGSYIKVVGDTQYTNALVNYGQGPWNSISDFKVNEQPIANFDSVYVYSRLGYLNQSVIPNFNDTYNDVYPARVVSSTSPEIYTTSISTSFDSILVDIVFPYGLFSLDDRGRYFNYSVEVKIEVSIKDADSWITITQQDIETFVSHTGFWAIKYINNFDRRLLVDGVGSTSPNAHFEGEDVIYWGPHATNVAGTWHWIATDDLYSTEVVNTFTIPSNNAQKPLHKIFEIEEALLDDSNQYDIRVTKVTADSTGLNKQETTTIGVVTYVQKADYQYPRQVLVGLNALATDQLSGSLDLNFLAECAIVNTYDGSNWLLQFNNNPAWVCYDTLTQPVISGTNVLNSYTEGERVDETLWTYVGGLFSIDGSQVADKSVSFTDALVGLSGDLTITVASGSGLTLYLGAGTTGINITTDGTSIHTLDAGRTSDDMYFVAPSSLVVTDFNLIVIEVISSNPYVIERYDGIDPARLDYAKFYEWAEYCDGLVNDGNGGTEKRCTFNGVFDSESTMWESALKVCQAGRAMLIWRGTTISLFIDKPAEPTQLFSIGNIEVDSFSERFLPQAERTGEMEASFLNADNDWIREEFTIINPNVDTGVNKIKMSFNGITSATEAYRLGMLRLKQNELIPRIISWKAAIDAIACEVGDVVWLQHNVPIWGVGGRIFAVVDSTSITLDQYIEYDENETYSILIRANDDSIIEREITAFSTSEPEDILVDEFNNTLIFEDGNSLGDGPVLTTITFVTPITADITLSPYSIGIVNQSTKKVRLINISKDQDEYVSLTAIDYNESIYNIDNDEPTMPTYNYSGLDVNLSVDNLAADERLENIRGIVGTVIDISFDSINSIIGNYQLYYQQGDGAIIHYGEVLSSGASIRDLTEGATYTFYIVVEDKFGRKQSFISSSKVTKVILGKTASPDPLANINLDIVNGMASFTWTQPAELDVQVGGKINIRHTSKTSGIIWDDGVDLAIASGASTGAQGVSLLNGSYIFQVVDSTGNVSSIVTYATGTIPSVFKFNAVTTLQEETTFTGTKTDMSVVSSTLRLTETAGVPALSGSYLFATGYDLGSVQTSRITSTIEALTYDISNDLDSILTLIDTWDSFDGPSVSGVTHELQVRTTDDDPAGTPTWSTWNKFTIGDYTTRAFEFKLVVTNTNENANIAFSQLQVAIDMPDRIEAVETVTCTVAGLTVTYTDAFQSVPALGIATQDMATGDYYTITSKTTSAFTIQFFDSTNTAIQRIFDWLAKGY